MIRIGMIGCGGMGNLHASQLAKLPNVKVVGTCDLIPEKAKAMAGRIGVSRSCTDFRELLPDVDAVWVCTEPFNRAEIVIESARAGKHVFTEKPIAVSLDDADRMIAAARKAKVKYMLGYCLRFWQPYRLIRDAFAGGELGELVSCWMRRFMPWNPGGWYGLQEKSGGVMLDFGSHDVDWLRWVGGDVKTVCGRTFHVRDGIRADDHGAAALLFRNGGIATIENSWSSFMVESTLGIIGTKGAIMMGGDGKVRRRIGHDGKEETVDVEAATAINPEGALGKRDANGRILKTRTQNESIQQHFIRCIEEDIEPLTPAIEGRKTLLTVMAIRESSRTGKSVEVDSMAKKPRAMLRK